MLSETGSLMSDGWPNTAQVTNQLLIIFWSSVFKRDIVILFFQGANETIPFSTPPSVLIVDGDISSWLMLTVYRRFGLIHSKFVLSVYLIMEW